jgi:hypothetical protein
MTALSASWAIAKAVVIGLPVLALGGVAFLYERFKALPWES